MIVFVGMSILYINYISCPAHLPIFATLLYCLLTMSFLANILPWVQVILAVLLVIAILLQQSQEGLGSAFGGGAGGGVFHAKRGAEKMLFISTIVLAGLFIILNIVHLFV